MSCSTARTTFRLALDHQPRLRRGAQTAGHRRRDPLRGAGRGLPPRSGGGRRASAACIPRTTRIWRTARARASSRRGGRGRRPDGGRGAEDPGRCRGRPRGRLWIRRCAVRRQRESSRYRAAPAARCAAPAECDRRSPGRSRHREYLRPRPRRLARRVVLAPGHAAVAASRARRRDARSARSRRRLDARRRAVAASLRRPVTASSTRSRGPRCSSATASAAW